jgi:rod shape-determining protein MreD
LWGWKVLWLLLFPIALQTTVFSRLNFMGVVPDLVLIIIICYGLLNGTNKGLFLGLIGGILLDLTAGGILGINIITKALIGFCAGYLERMVFKDNLFVPILSVLAGTIISELLSFLILSAFGWRMGFFSFFFSILCPLCLYHIVLTGPIYIILLKALNWYKHRKKVGA